MANEELVPVKDRAVAPINKDTLAEYSQDQLIRNAPRLIPRTFRSLQKLADQGDRKALELILQAYNYLKPAGGGISVVTNLYNNNVNVQKEDGKATQYLEGIIARLEKEERDRSRANVIDAEVVE